MPQEREVQSSFCTFESLSDSRMTTRRPTELLPST